MNYFEVEQHFWRRMNEEGGVIPTLQAMGKTIVVAEGSHPARVRSTSQHSHPARWPRSGEVPLSRRACTQCFPQTRRPGQSSAARTISTSRTRTSRASPSHLRSTVSGSCSTCRGAVFVSRCSVHTKPSSTQVRCLHVWYVVHRPCLILLLVVCADGWMDTWIDFYTAEPFSDGNLTTDEKARVLGGMAEQWSEQVDGSSLESRMWPRGLAVAERLWSPRETTLVENVTVARLQRASCQVLERRGSRGGPVQPGFCPWSLGWD